MKDKTSSKLEFASHIDELVKKYKSTNFCLNPRLLRHARIKLDMYNKKNTWYRRQTKKNPFQTAYNTGLQKKIPSINFQSPVRFSPAEYEYESHFFLSRPDFRNFMTKV